MRRPLLLRDGSSWEFRYGCRTATRTFWQFLVDDFRANETFVFEVLGITREQRKRQENLITPKDEELVFTSEELAERRQQKVSELKTLRTINKGLAMELLVATMLSCLDSPQAVRPWCAVSAKGDPKMSAGPGFEDILVTYGGFSIVAEVSAKRDASTDTDFFRRQLEQALDHADRAAGRGDRRRVRAGDQQVLGRHEPPDRKGVPGGPAGVPEQGAGPCQGARPRRCERDPAHTAPVLGFL